MRVIVFIVCVDEKHITYEHVQSCIYTTML